MSGGPVPQSKGKAEAVRHHAQRRTDRIIHCKGEPDMNRPYTICHMMTSVDGRIDCAMTEHLPGVQDYYNTLDALGAPTRVSGRVTAQLEMAQPGEFASGGEPVGHEVFSVARRADGYEAVVDTHGTLLWNGDEGGQRPLLIITSEQVGRDYLDYLAERGISYIACGHDRIDLARACELLANEFGVERMAVGGGGHINAGFLAAGLLDEVSLLIGSGIDGRGGMSAIFAGLPACSTESRAGLPPSCSDLIRQSDRLFFEFFTVYRPSSFSFFSYSTTP